MSGRALYHRIDDANYHTPDIARAMFDWLDERLLCGDVFEALRDALPDTPDVDLLNVLTTISKVVQQP